MFRSSRKQPSQPASSGAAAGDALEQGARTRILLEALADLAETLDVDEVLDRILARSLQVSEAEQALVLLGDLESGLAARSALRAGGSKVDPEQVAFSSSMVHRALEDGRPVIQELGSDTEALEAGQSLFDLKLRSVLCAPLMYRGETLGAIYVDSRVQRKTFTQSDRDLFEALARQAAIAIKNARLMKASVERARLAHELSLAREIQRDLLPQGEVRVPGLEIAGANVACEEISGDFYDFIPRPDGAVAVWVADVSGHGVGPALLAAEVRGEIRALLPLYPDPGQVLTRVHANLRETMDPGRFLTLVLTVVDPLRGTLAWASAGHPESLLRKGGDVLWLERTGPPLGVDVEVEHLTRHLDGLQPGDGMLLYSDGLVETRSADGELFGEERLAGAALQGTGPAADQVQRLLDGVAAFNAGRRNDDRTAVVVLWREP